MAKKQIRSRKRKDNDLSNKTIGVQFENPMPTFRINGRPLLPSTDQPPIYNQKGEQQSGEYRADRLPMQALLHLSHLLKKGADRHKDEDPENPKWMATPTREHLNRALTHIFSFLSGNKQEDHLANAACRLLFALQVDLLGVSSPKV
jgi:hypothetical protein